MRFVVYNIRYGTGSGLRFHLPLPFSGYLKPNGDNFTRIVDYLRSLEPDIIGLLEVDFGSYRTKKSNQAAALAEALGFRPLYRPKYGEASPALRVPLMKKQGNAFLTNQKIQTQEFLYFQEGIKRLVIKLELESCVIYLVHLSLKYRHRQNQLSDLYTLFRDSEKPVIVAGDMNTFWGDRELELFLAASGLVNANGDGLPTFPSHSPRWQLDFVLHSPSLRVKRFFIPRVRFSDHLPLVFDFEA